MVAKGEGGRERDGLGVCRCKLLHIEWINNKVLMYIRGNYIEYLVLNHNGNTHTHTHTHIYIYIYKTVSVCVTESLCYIAEVAQHYKSTILQ